MPIRSVFLSILTAAGLCLGAANASAADMEFELVPFGDQTKCGRNCPEVISAVGEITTTTPKSFYDFVASNIRDPRMRSIVFLHSPGGSVAASMRLGTMFRKTGVAAVVARLARADGGGVALPGGRCYSACVYALMGAKKRIIPPPSLVGIHRMSIDEHERDLSTLADITRRKYGTPDFVAQLANYANAMGVSRDLIYTAERINPDNIHIVTSEEMRRWRLAAQKF
jgi:hypothetical protein